jgi:hypothetical protein
VKRVLSLSRAHLRAAAGASLAAIALLLGLAYGAASTACSDTAAPLLCTGIPDGGCPRSHGVACDDPACAAVYACFSGVWSLDHACPARDAGATDARDIDAGDAALSPRDAGFDVPPGASGGPGCADLEPPDCTLATALACPSNSCCGCEDLFVCRDAGWLAWGACGDGGAIAPR